MFTISGARGSPGAVTRCLRCRIEDTDVYYCIIITIISIIIIIVTIIITIIIIIIIIISSSSSSSNNSNHNSNNTNRCSRSAGPGAITLKNECNSLDWWRCVKSLRAYAQSAY